MNQSFALKGICIRSIDRNTIDIIDGYVISENGICQGIYKEVPMKYQGITIHDYSPNLIVPGFTDLHLHAPQYTFRGTGMDLELLDWLETYTFPEEAKYADLEYARESYALFAQDLKNSATTRACIFGTVHTQATQLLMDMLEETGMKTMVGKVNMDRNCSDYLMEESVQKSLDDTILFLEYAKKKYKNTMPILTPRFIPTCSDELMRGLSKIKESYHIPLQSHLSENPSEIEWVKELCVNATSYADAYDKAGAFHPAGNTVMAHCVYLTEEEEDLLKEKNAFIAHCPESNMNLASGIAPVRKLLKKGLQVGLGTDVAGGSSVNLLHAMSLAIQLSKIYWRMTDDKDTPLTIEEVFYMATKGGGAFFGKVGSFEKGYQMDAVILSDDNIKTTKAFTAKERLERLVYLGSNENVAAKYVDGVKVK